MSNNGLSMESRGGATLDEVAKELGVTKERVRQIEKSALKKLRRWCNARRLKFADLDPGIEREVIDEQ